MVKSKYGVDLTGLRFGRWTVLNRGNKKSGGNVFWLCRCDCGKEKEIQRPLLVGGMSTQCRECADRPRYVGNIYLHYFTNLKKGAQRSGLIFDLTLEYVGELLKSQDSRCALSGLPIDFHSNPGMHSGTISLDRIDSFKGYVVGNVQWVHRSINFMKGSLSQMDFILLCKKVGEKWGDKILKGEETSWMPQWRRKKDEDRRSRKRKREERTYHVNPFCKDATKCLPHGEDGPVLYYDEG